MTWAGLLRQVMPDGFGRKKSLDPVGCRRSPRGATYADIKSLMSSSDRAVDLDLRPSDLAKMDNNAVARARNLSADGGHGDDTGLLLLYPISKDSVPVRASARTREPLDAVEHVLGVGLVFPQSLSTAADVEYKTADIGSMPDVAVDAPDEADYEDGPEGGAS